MKYPLLRYGATGGTVRLLQFLLKDAGYLSGEPDGIFGNITQNAVKAFQKDGGYVVDGVVGQQTWKALHRMQDNRLLTEKDLQSAAEDLGCELAMIKAISEVESSGRGFLEDGRPKILYERHLMRRFLVRDGLTTLVELASTHLPNIVDSLTGGYVGGAAEWDRFNTAYGLHRQFAIQATSWGRYQILGMHWERLGMASAEAMKLCMERSEKDHLEALVGFIKTDARLLRATREKDFTTFAEIYNGPSHRSYDKKMEAAYHRLIT